MSECRELAEWAETLDARPPAASERFIMARIEYLEAILPTRNTDEAAGQKRTAGYLAVLRGHSRGALQYLATESLTRFDWFPSPKQCIEVMAEYREPYSERETVLRLCADFAQAAFDRWLVALIEGQPIGDVPERWIGIAVERGPLRRLAGGAIVSRALYHGPYLPLGGRP